MKIKTLLKATTGGWNTPASIFLVLLAFAVVRLAHMQLFTHEKWETVGSDTENVLQYGEIVDREGYPISGPGTVTDLVISTFRKKSCQRDSNNQCKKNKNGQIIYEKNADGTDKMIADLPKMEDNPLEYPTCTDSAKGVFSRSVKNKWFGWIFGRKFTFRSHCLAYQKDKAEKNLIFQEEFQKNIPFFNECSKSENKSKTNCRSINYADYLKYRSKLQEISEIKSIPGFKFYPEQNGIMDNICRSIKSFDEHGAGELYGSDAKDKVMGKKDNAKDKENDFNAETVEVRQLTQVRDLFVKYGSIERKNKTSRQAEREKIRSVLGVNEDKDVFKSTMTVAGYCEKINPGSNWIIAVNRKKMFNKGIFAVSYLTGKDEAKKRELSKRGYCKGKYNDSDCIDLYKNNLDKIGNFLCERTKTECEGIGKKIDEFKNFFPKSTEIAKEVSKKDNMEGKDMGEKIKDFSKFVWKKIKGFPNALWNFIKDIYVKIKIPLMDMLHIEAKANEDEDAKDITLITLSSATYHKILPSVNVASKHYKYYTSGIEFQKRDEYINMLGTTGIPAYKDIDCKHKNSNTKEYCDIKTSDEVMSKILPKIKEDSEKNLTKLLKDCRESWFKTPDQNISGSCEKIQEALNSLKAPDKDKFRVKPSKADHIMAPYLGLSLGGINIMEIIKKESKGEIKKASSDQDSRSIVEKYNPCRKGEYGEEPAFKEGEEAYFYVYITDSKSLKKYKGTCSKSGKIDKYSSQTWRGIVPKYMEQLSAGSTVQLTIDYRIQAEAEHELAKRCEELKADRGFALVQDVNTGELIAMAEYSSPYAHFSYMDKDDYRKGNNEIIHKTTLYTDYGQWNDGSPTNMTYRAYKPGSIFKPISIAIALENGVVDPNAKFAINYVYVGKDRKHKAKIESKENIFSSSNASDVNIAGKAWDGIKDSSDDRCKKNNNVIPSSIECIIAKSSNIGTSMIIEKLWNNKDKQHFENLYAEQEKAWDRKEKKLKDPESLTSAYKKVKEDSVFLSGIAKFGFGQSTGLGAQMDIREAPGSLIFDDNKPKAPSLFFSEYLKTSYGQGPLAATPPQIISAYSALVNGGTLYSPRIIKSIDGKETEISSSVAISPDISQKMRGYMKAVMEYGTGHGIIGKIKNGTDSELMNFVKSFFPDDAKTKTKIYFAGKTGTADMPEIGGGLNDRKGNGKANLASFAAFVPADNPKYSILVMIDENAKMSMSNQVKNPYHPDGANASCPLAMRLAGLVDRYLIKNSTGAVSSSGNNQ